MKKKDSEIEQAAKDAAKMAIDAARDAAGAEIVAASVAAFADWAKREKAPAKAIDLAIESYAGIKERLQRVITVRERTNVIGEELEYMRTQSEIDRGYNMHTEATAARIKAAQHSIWGSFQTTANADIKALDSISRAGSYIEEGAALDKIRELMRNERPPF